MFESPYSVAVIAIATFVTAVVTLLVFLVVQFDRQQQRNSTIGITDEPTDIKPEFENLPNFRQAGGTSLKNRHGQMVKNGLLYRSSRTDYLTEEEASQFSNLGIKAIVDLRRNSEYAQADGNKVLDKWYLPCVMKNGVIKNWAISKRGIKKQTSSADASSCRGRRYLVNVMNIKTIKSVIGRVNIFVRYSSLALLLVDKIFSCHLFVRLFNHLVSNRQDLSDQYVLMLEHTKQEVADILRLFLEEENVPVLIHCAHGKDRTGVIIAIILGCLEVEDEVIAEDYSKSEAGLAPMKKRLFMETVGRYGFKTEFTRATVETMMTMLHDLKESYGSISGYLESAGFSFNEQKELKAVFLEQD